MTIQAFMLYPLWW